MRVFFVYLVREFFRWCHIFLIKIQSKFKPHLRIAIFHLWFSLNLIKYIFHLIAIVEIWWVNFFLEGDDDYSLFSILIICCRKFFRLCNWNRGFFTFLWQKFCLFLSTIKRRFCSLCRQNDFLTYLNQILPHVRLFNLQNRGYVNLSKERLF